MVGVEPQPWLPYQLLAQNLKPLIGTAFVIVFVVFSIFQNEKISSLEESIAGFEDQVLNRQIVPVQNADYSEGLDNSTEKVQIHFSTKTLSQMRGSIYYVNYRSRSCIPIAPLVTIDEVHSDRFEGIESPTVTISSLEESPKEIDFLAETQLYQNGGSGTDLANWINDNQIELDMKSIEQIMLDNKDNSSIHPSIKTLINTGCKVSSLPTGGVVSFTCEQSEVSELGPQFFAKDEISCKNFLTYVKSDTL